VSVMATSSRGHSDCRRRKLALAFRRHVSQMPFDRDAGSHWSLLNRTDHHEMSTLFDEAPTLHRTAPSPRSQARHVRFWARPMGPEWVTNAPPAMLASRPEVPSFPDTSRRTAAKWKTLEVDARLFEYAPIPRCRAPLPGRCHVRFSATSAAAGRLHRIAQLRWHCRRRGGAQAGRLRPRRGSAARLCPGRARRGRHGAGDMARETGRCGSSVSGSATRPRRWRGA
jgi:hypothetical protein